jgi:hypothetical protein
MRGIVEWWLPKQQIAENLREVETALSKLVARGQLVTRRAPDGQVFFRSAGSQQIKRESLE